MSTLERTGLYIEGVYRKSGAAPKVKELKAALEAGNVFYTSSIRYSIWIYWIYHVTCHTWVGDWVPAPTFSWHLYSKQLFFHWLHQWLHNCDFLWHTLAGRKCLNIITKPLTQMGVPCVIVMTYYRFTFCVCLCRLKMHATKKLLKNGRLCMNLVCISQEWTHTLWSTLHAWSPSLICWPTIATASDGQTLLQTIDIMLINDCHCSR